MFQGVCKVSRESPHTTSTFIREQEVKILAKFTIYVQKFLFSTHFYEMRKGRIIKFPLCSWFYLYFNQLSFQKNYCFRFVHNKNLRGEGRKHAK